MEQVRQDHAKTGNKAREAIAIKEREERLSCIDAAAI
jgi:hypothetical protein